MTDKQIIEKIKSIAMKYEPCARKGKNFNADSCWEHSCDSCLVPAMKEIIKLCKQMESNDNDR